MQLMADGLAGHEMDFYEIVRSSPWLGGTKEYSELNEGIPYWFNGLVSLAYGIDDDRLKEQVKNASTYILSHQNETTGWLGPEKTYTSKNLWSRFPLALGMMQLAEADPTTTDAIVSALYKFIPAMNSVLSDNDVANEIWGRVRYADMVIVLQWLHTYHQNDSGELLLTAMKNLRTFGRDWIKYFTPPNFPTADLDTLPLSVTEPMFPFVHGVNAGQGLKNPGVIYRFSKESSLPDLSLQAINETLTYHGTASGVIIGDERLAGLGPNRGTELCTVVETMYSLTYLHSLLGDASIADAAERAAYNALPPMLTPNHWAHQYIALPNQPWTTKNPQHAGLWWNVGEDGQIFAIEPNYPCCAVNHPQGWPKYLAASFASLGTDTIVHTLLAPATVKTKLDNDAEVSIECATTYPFGSTLSYSIASSSAAKLAVRVPNWQDGSKTPEITVNGTPLTPTPTISERTRLITIPIASGSSTVTYTLNPTLRTESRANDTIAVYHGSLLYALDIGEVSSSTPPTYPGAPKEAVTVTYNSTSAWNIAIDPSTLSFSTGDDTGALANPIWVPNGPPASITAQGCEINWSVDHGVPAAVPLTDQRSCIGSSKLVTLRPYGSLRVRVAEIPVVVGTSGGG